MLNRKTDCYTCANLKCLIKKHVHNAEVETYLEKKHTIICKKNQQFILEGAPLNGLFFIYTGMVKVTKTSINGREEIVRFATDGNIVGHRGFGTGNRYRISASSFGCNPSTCAMDSMQVTNAKTCSFVITSF